MQVLSSARIHAIERMFTMLDRLSGKLGRTPNRAPHLALGIRGEEAAFFYCRRVGYIVTARGWRSHRYAGDLDLIGWEGDCLCFIEVKARTTRDVASAESAVDESKRTTLRKIARHYLRQLPEPAATRFDILSIYFEREMPPDFLLFRNAFGWSEAPGYRASRHY
jgi:putative endonuclease